MFGIFLYKNIVNTERWIMRWWNKAQQVFLLNYCKFLLNQINTKWKPPFQRLERKRGLFIDVAIMSSFNRVNTLGLTQRRPSQMSFKTNWISLLLFKVRLLLAPRLFEKIRRSWTNGITRPWTNGRIPLHQFTGTLDWPYYYCWADIFITRIHNGRSVSIHNVNFVYNIRRCYALTL